MEAHRRKATLENYTRQTWEEMKLADSEFEKHERLQEHRSKQAASEKVRLQREAERKKLEENKRREEAEQRRLEQQVARIRNREVEKGSRLVKEREIMRKRAERREWQLLQDYFTNKSEHETLEKKRTAEVCQGFGENPSKLRSSVCHGGGGGKITFFSYRATVKRKSSVRLWRDVRRSLRRLPPLRVPRRSRLFR